MLGVKIALGVYGIAILIAGVIVARDPGYFGNVGFLVIGALLGIYPIFVIEEWRRHVEARQIAKALFHELANRAGRCCFDFEDPWRAYLQQPEEMAVYRLRKFAPDAPVIYLALAPQIGLLDDDAAQAIIDFYIAHAAWQREVETAVRQYAEVRTVHPGAVEMLAERLRRTLLPAQRALAALARRVPAADTIERHAMKHGDSLFPERHPHAGKTLSERIALALKSATS
jgi:hypothetical protein